VPGRLSSFAVASVFASAFAITATVAKAGHAAGNDGFSVDTPVVRAHPGPWGRLESVNVTLTPPADLLRGMNVASSPPRWRVPGVNRKDLARMLSTAGEPDSAVSSWVAPAHSSEFPEGLGLAPTCPMIRRLGERARAALYSRLEQDSANAGDRWRFPARYVDTFAGFGLPQAVPADARALSVREGNFLTSYCISCLFPAGAPVSERNAFLEAVSQQSSRELRLRVEPGDDAGALAEYWGAGRSATEKHALAGRFEAAANRPGGGMIPLGSLLPPLPSALLHAYRIPTAYVDGPGPSRNCAWTALNFYRRRPVPAYEDASRAAETLTRDFEQVARPRFGDVAVFLTPDAYMIHLATYLADDLYFTKNGENALHPWVVNSIGELRDSFAYGLPPGKGLTVRYYRIREGRPGV
jgi:hypothetical protein